MIKYINADDVYDGMRKHGFEAKYITRGEFVDFLPSADVAEIVRCKDCKHYINRQCDCFDGLCCPKPDDFCSYGERKETDDKTRDS